MLICTASSSIQHILVTTHKNILYTEIQFSIGFLKKVTLKLVHKKKYYKKVTFLYNDDFKSQPTYCMN